MLGRLSDADAQRHAVIDDPAGAGAAVQEPFLKLHASSPMGAKFKCPDDNMTFSAIRRFQAGMAPQTIVDELVGLNVDRDCAEKVVARVVASFDNKKSEEEEEALQQERQADGKGKAVWGGLLLVLGLAITIGGMLAMR